MKQTKRSGTKSARKQTRSTRSNTGRTAILPKEELLDEITAVVRYRHLNQGQLAALVNDAPSQMSLLMNGKLQGFSTDRLLRILLRLGRDIDVVVRAAPPGRRIGKVRLLTR